MERGVGSRLSGRGVDSGMHAPPSTDAVRTRLAALLPELRARYAVRSLALFGSYARGEQTAQSDLDLLVELDGAPDLYDLVGIKLDVEDALGLPADVVMREAVRAFAWPSIRHDLLPV